MLAWGAAHGSIPRRPYLIEQLENRCLLSGITFGTPITTPLPNGFQFAGALETQADVAQVIAKNAAGGGLLYTVQSDGSLKFVQSLNVSGQILWFTQVYDSLVVGSHIQMLTTADYYVEGPVGTFTRMTNFTYPSDAISNAFAFVYNGLAIERFVADPSHPGLGNIVLADYTGDLQYGGPVTEVDTVIAADVSRPAFASPILPFPTQFNSPSELYVNGRTWLQQSDGTFAIAPSQPTAIPGLRPDTKFYSNVRLFTPSGVTSADFAFPVDGTNGGDAACEFAPNGDGSILVYRTIDLGGNSDTSGALVPDYWANGQGEDLLTTLVDGPGSPAIEVMPAGFNGRFGTPLLISSPDITPFASTTSNPSSGNPTRVLLASEQTSQGFALVSVPQTFVSSGETVTASIQSPVVGEPITLTADFSGTYDGNTVTFFDGSQSIGQTTLGSAGTTQLVTSRLAVGSHQITATVAGTFSQTTDALTIVVNPPPASLPYVAVTAFSFNQDQSFPTNGTVYSSPPDGTAHVSFTLTNLGSAIASGNVQVSVQITSMDLFDAGPFTLPISPLSSVTVNLAPGAGQTLSGQITFPDDLQAGTYVVTASTSGDSGLHLSTADTTPFVIQANLPIDWRFGRTAQGTDVPLVRHVSADDTVTFSLTGGGVAVLSTDDSDVTLGTDNPDYALTLSQTTANSSLVITQTGTTQSNIATLTFLDTDVDALGSADLRQDTPHALTLGPSGGYINTTINSLMLGTIPLAIPRGAPDGTKPTVPGSVTGSGVVHNLSVDAFNGADIAIYGADFTTPMAVKIGTMSSGSEFHTTQPISDFEVGSADSGSLIDAYYIDILKSSGDFDANLPLSQTPGLVPALGMLQVGGSIAGSDSDDATWWLAGNVGSINVSGSISNLQCVIGAAEKFDQYGDPTNPVSYTYSTASLGRLSVGGSVSNTNVGAGVDLGASLVLTAKAKLLSGGKIGQLLIGGTVDSNSHFLASQVPGVSSFSTYNHLQWITQPADANAGQRLPALSIAVVDAGGNRLQSSGGFVSLSISSGANTGVTLQHAPIRDGVATFKNLKLTAASFYTLEANAPEATPLETSQFLVSPAAPARLHLDGSAAGNGESTDIFISLRDKYQNLITDSSITFNVGRSIASVYPANPIPFFNGEATISAEIIGPAIEKTRLVFTASDRRIPRLVKRIVV
jgi:hypothetical protein